MLTPRRVAAPILAVLISACTSSRQEDPEHAVIRAFLQSTQAEKLEDSALYEQAGIFFIYNLDQEKPEEIRTFFQKRAAAELEPALVQDFVTRNHAPAAIDRAQLPTGLRFEREFMKKNVYSISRPGFNADQDEALIYVSYSSMSEFGHGSLVHLAKRFGRWRVKNMAAVWVYG